MKSFTKRYPIRINFQRCFVFSVDKGLYRFVGLFKVVSTVPSYKLYRAWLITLKLRLIIAITYHLCQSWKLLISVIKKKVAISVRIEERVLSCPYSFKAEHRGRGINISLQKRFYMSILHLRPVLRSFVQLRISNPCYIADIYGCLH